MKIRKIVALILSVLMLAVTFAGCASDNDPETTTDTAAVTTDKPEDTVTQVVSTKFEEDDIDPSLNYDNAVFTILAWKQGILEYEVETSSGDNIETALFSRNMAVEQRLGVDLKYEIIDGNSKAVDQFVNHAFAAISNNTHTYDAVASYTRCAGVLATKLAFVDMNIVDNLNFDKPWWPASLVEMNNISDKMYFASGDIATSLIYQMMFMVYNDDYGTQLGLTNPQQMALDGGWTLPKMFELCDKGYEDIDDKTDKSEGDRFGLYFYNHPFLDIFYMGAGLSYVKSTDDGKLVISEDFKDERSINVVNMLAAKFKSDSYFYGTSSSVSQTRIVGNSLLYNVNGSDLAGIFRDAEFKYCILPGPKYNNKQADYYTAVGFPHSMYSIPTDARNVAMSGAVLECLASESYRKVTPEVFETSFKCKFAKTDADSDMLNIIRDRVAFDIGRTFFEALGGDSSSPIRLWRNSVVNGSGLGPGTLYERYNAQWNKALEEVVSLIENVA